MTITAKEIYKTVATLGMTRAQVRALLPSWWDPAYEIESNGAIERGLHVSRRLNLDLGALMAGRAKPKGALFNVAYKHRADVAPDKLIASSLISSSLAEAIIAALEAPYRALPSTPGALRAAAAHIGYDQLGFDALLALCWAHGVPVIPLPNLPVGMRKMDGAALNIADRPAIIIAKRKHSRAWLSFILAHEMAHIALGHVASGSSIIDVSLQDSATYATESSTDNQEREADEFALAALGGPALDAEVSNWSTRMAPVAMAVAARALTNRLNVEPGHAILRYAFQNKRWAEASQALRFLSEDLDPQAALLKHLQSNIQLESIADDLQDLVAQVTGIVQG